MSLTLITEPECEPITLAEAKLRCRVDLTDDDDDIESLIVTAREEAENRTKRQCVAATYELVLDGFPESDGPIELPKPPLQDVESIIYIDENGVEQTLGSGLYEVDTDSLVGRVYPSYEQIWPTTREQPNAVRIRYVTGWPTTQASPPAATTPKSICNWIKIRVEELYNGEEHRETLDGLLSRWVIRRVL